VIIFEDNEIRVEAHVTETWITMAPTASGWGEVSHYRCGEHWSNGDPCNNINVFAVHGNVCHRVYAKAKSVTFICGECAKGTHDQCTKSNCDCQHRTEQTHG